MPVRSKLLPSQEYLKECFSYNPETGSLIWNKRPENHFKTKHGFLTFNGQFANREALVCIDSNGYNVGGINGEFIAKHRVIYKLMYGIDPEYIDHIDGNKQNNVLNNLRNVGQPDNSRNLGISIANTSGRVGVYWIESQNNWRSTIKVKGKSIHLGLFDTFKEACEARERAEKHHGFHENYGKVRLQGK